MKGCRNGSNNQGILVLAALASIQIVQGLNNDQIQTLGAFFTVLGDNLALLAAPPCWRGSTEEQEAGEG